MFKKAFTMVELVVALLLVAILAAVTIGIARNKMAKVDKYSYYIAYSTMQDIAANIISQTEYDVDENGLAAVSIYDNKYIAKNSPSYKYTFGLGIQDSYNGDMSNNIGGGATMCRKNGLSCQTNKACCSNLCDPVRHICVDQLSNDNGDSPTCSNDYKGVCDAYGLTWKSATCQCVTQCANSNHEIYVDNYGVTKCRPKCPEGKTRNSAGQCVCSGSKPSNSHYTSDCGWECDTGYEVSGGSCRVIVNCGANEVKTESNTCVCKEGYESASDGTCVQLCSANQYRDEATKTCKNCVDITTWAEYQTHMPPCPPDCERFGMVYNEEKGTCVAKNTAENLCKRIKAEYNISGSACDITAATMSAGVANGFSAQTPHIKLSNGTNLYIASDLVKLEELSDAADKKDRIAYLVYVDVNGEKKGKGVLYQDVFPFYLTMSGKVIPAYSSTVSGGGNSAEHLSLNIVYDDYTESGNRVVKAEKTNLDFVTAACETGYIRSAKYCGAMVPLDICSDPGKDCRFIVNKPMKFFR